MNEQTAEILDRCLADVRAGRETVASCLARHPDHREELEALLPAALAIVPPTARLDPQRKLRARHAFVETVAREKRNARRVPWFGAWQLPTGARAMRLAAIAVNILALLILTTTAVATAREAQPGDLLYGLKTSIEQVQVAVALTPETKAHLRLQIAAERLTEVQRALASDRTGVADTAATAYAATMDQAQRDLAAARPSGPRLDAIQRALQENLARQEEILIQASEKGATGTEHAIREVRAQVSHLAPSRAAGGPANVTGVVRPVQSTPQATPTPTPAPEAPSGESEPSRRVVQLAGETPVPTPSTPAPTATPIPTATSNPPWLAVSDALGIAGQTTVVTSIPAPALSPTVEPTRTPTVTATRRATVTPSITPTAAVTSSTAGPGPSVSPARRGGVETGDEVGRPWAVPAAAGSMSASGRTPTSTPTTARPGAPLHRGSLLQATPVPGSQGAGRAQALTPGRLP